MAAVSTPTGSVPKAKHPSPPRREAMAGKVAGLIDADLSERERAPLAALQTQAARSVMKVPNMTERLHELRCPIFGFWGVNDIFNPVGGAMKIVQHAPQARMLLVNRCGHWVQVEHRDLFNRQCLDFLQHG